MPFNDRPDKVPGKPASDPREPSAEPIDDFAQLVVKEFVGLKSALEQRAPERAQAIIGDLLKLPKQEFVTTVMDLAEDLQIDDLKKADPKFNRFNAFLRSVGNTALLGAPERIAALLEAPFSDKTVGQIINDQADRSRLMSKAFPGATVTGMLGGFLMPGPGKAVFGAGAKAATRGTKFTADMATKLVERIGKDPGFAKRVGGLIDNALTRTAAEGAAGGAAFAAAKGSTNLAADVVLGAVEGQDVPNAIQQLGEKVMEDAESGAKYGAAFAAGGMTAAATFRAARWGMKKGASLLGKDLKYQAENLELVRDVLEATPELVIAESAEKMAPVLAREQGKLKAIETSAKNEIVQGLGTRRIELTNEFQKTADELSNAVTELRQASETKVARAATKLQDTLGKAYAARNRAYGEKLDEIVGSTEANVSLKKPLELADKVLRANGALDGKGKLLGGSDWAKANPELFSSLSEIWQRLGGEVKAAGGKAGITKNLKDTIQLQRQVGELANFGKRPTYFERVFRDLYFGIRDQAEAVAPGLRPLNQGFTADRVKLDDFRSVVGKAEQNIANKLRKNLEDNRNLFVREALEGFAGLSDETAAATKEGFSVSSRLQLLNNFKKNPKQVFTQLRQAYLNNDTLVIGALEKVAGQNPGLRNYLETARRQAAVLAEMPKPGEAKQAAANPEIARRVVEAAPATEGAIARAQGARSQADELARVLPADRLALEQRLKGQRAGADPAQQAMAEEAGLMNDFLAGELERQVVNQTVAGAPELAEPLKRAEAARVASRLRSGKVQKTLAEEFPVFGKWLFQLRKVATPAASRFLNQVSKASPKLKNNLIAEMWDNLEGTGDFPKAALGGLIQRVEPEAALVIYAQNGGAEDIIRAAEKTGIALDADDEQENNPR